jgi:hypothetical protein
MLTTLALFLGLVGASPTPALTAQSSGGEVDVELVLAVDVSRSMDMEESNVQRAGYVEALRHPDFIKAVRGGLVGRIALSYFEWAGNVEDSSLVGWKVIETAADANAFATELESHNVATRRGTSISQAIAYGATLLHSNSFTGMRKVIDVSGDGANNIGAPVVPARDAAVATGVIINGLAIMIRPSGMGASLDRYYGDCVIGGPGAFVLPVHNIDDFAVAIRRKLVMEVSGLPDASPKKIAMPSSADCMMGEKERYDWMEK